MKSKNSLVFILTLMMQLQWACNKSPKQEDFGEEYTIVARAVSAGAATRANATGEFAKEAASDLGDESQGVERVQIQTLPAKFSNDTKFKVSLNPVSYAQYRYAVVYGDNSCEQAEFSDWQVSGSSIAIDDQRADGSRRLCVIGRNVYGHEESVEYAWTKDSKAPNPVVGETSHTALDAMQVEVAGDGVVRYRYAHIVGDGDCSAASYSDWLDVTSELTVAFADAAGAQQVCVETADAAGNISPAVSQLRPYAQLTNTPAAYSNDPALDITVSGTSVSQYRYALLTGLSDCGEASYSEWFAVNTKLTSSVGADGSKLLCVQARTSAGALQPHPTTFAWVSDSQPPDSPTLRGTPSGLSNGTSLAVTVSGSDVHAYRFAVLTGAPDCQAASYGNWILASELLSSATGSDGSKLLCVQARDQAENVQELATNVSWVQDTTAPSSTLIGTPADPSTATTITITVTSLGSDAVSYRYALLSSSSSCSEATYSAWAAASSPLTASLGSDGSKTLCVYSQDAAGNTESTPVSYTWTKDTTAPSLTLSGYPNGTSNSSVLNASVSDADTYEYRYALTTAGNCNAVAYSPYRSRLVAVSDTLGGDATYRLCLLGRDEAGNMQTVASELSWIKDTVAPAAGALTLSSTPSDPSNSTSLGVSVHGADISYYKYKIGPASSTSCASATDYSSEYARTSTITAALTSLSDTTLRLCVYGRDSAGNDQNLSDAITVDWVKDTAGPLATSVSLTGAPSSTSKETMLSVAIAGDGSTHYKYKVGTAATTDCSVATNYSAEAAIGSPLSTDISTLAETSLRLCILTRDAAGNWMALSSAKASVWTKDTTAPTVAITGNPSSPSNSTALNVSISDSDTHEYKYALTTAANCNAVSYSAYTARISPITESLGSDATYRLCLIGRDAVGNEQATATEVSWVKDTTAPGAGALTLSGTPANPSNTTTLAVTTSGADITHYKYKVGLQASTNCSAATDYSSSEHAKATNITSTINTLADGTLRLCVYGRDAAGNYQDLSHATAYDWVKDTTAPAAASLSLGGAPSDPSQDIGLNITVSGDGSTHYKHKVGLASSTSCSSSTGYGAETAVTSKIIDNISSLSDASLTLCVISRDTAGNWMDVSAAKSFTWFKDAHDPAPGNSGNLTVSSVDLTSLTLSWAKASDVDSATPQASLRYQVYRSTSANIDTLANMDSCEAATSCVVELAFTTNIATRSITSLSSNTLYYFNVRVKDNIGREAVYTMTSQRTPPAVHIVYKDTTNGRIKYTKTATSISSFSAENAETIAADTLSLAIDGNKKAHIAYRTGSDLRYLTNKSSAWAASSVDSGYAQSNTDIAVDSSNNPHVLYYRFDSNKDWKHQYHDGTSWLATPDKVWNGNGSAIKGHSNVIVLATDNKVHAVGYDASNLDVIHNTNAAGSWSNTNVAVVDSTGDVGSHLAVARDGSNNLYVAYYDLTNGDLKYAKRSASTWEASVALDQTDNVGQYTGIAVTSDGNIHIVYYDVTNTNLKYICHNGVAWQTAVIIDGASGDVGKYASIAADQANKVHVSYYDVTNGDLKYASGSCGASWSTASIDTTGDVGSYSDIAVDR